MYDSRGKQVINLAWFLADDGSTWQTSEWLSNCPVCAPQPTCSASSVARQAVQAKGLSCISLCASLLPIPSHFTSNTATTTHFISLEKSAWRTKPYSPEENIYQSLNKDEGKREGKSPCLMLAITTSLTPKAGDGNHRCPSKASAWPFHRALKAAVTSAFWPTDCWSPESCCGGYRRCRGDCTGVLG